MQRPEPLRRGADFVSCPVGRLSVSRVPILLLFPPCLLPRVPILLPPPLPWLLQVPVPLMRFRTLRQSFSIDVCPLLVLSPSISPSAIDLRVCDLKLELTASRVRGRAREGVMCDISGLHCAMQSGCEGAARDPSGLWGS